jgi:hypothetical protein
MKYGNIPKDVLNKVIGECYGLGDYTLKDELDKYGEDIIVAQWNMTKTNRSKVVFIEWFRAWTKTYSLCLISSGFGDECILGLNREIPEELNGRSKEKRKRTKCSNSKTNK